MGLLLSPLSTTGEFVSAELGIAGIYFKVALFFGITMQQTNHAYAMTTYNSSQPLETN